MRGVCIRKKLSDDIGFNENVTIVAERRNLAPWVDLEIVFGPGNADIDMLLLVWDTEFGQSDVNTVSVYFSLLVAKSAKFLGLVYLEDIHGHCRTV